MKKYKTEVQDELTKNILPFWIEKVADKENGGFYGYVSNDLIIKKDAPKGSVLCARILWTYSQAFRITKDEKYLKISELAYKYLLNYFVDKKYNGLYWMLDHKGNPINPKKQIYAQAFGIYGLSEYYMISKDKKSLDKAIELFDLIEEHSYDSEKKGYLDACNDDWTLAEDMTLSEKDINAQKTMNTHLHIMEAYTNLYRVWKDDRLKEKLYELINITIEKIIDPSTYHFNLYFDEDWNSMLEHFSYGHDIEGSWLLFEAAEVLEDEKLIKKVREISIKMAEIVYNEGIDEDGGILNEGSPKGVIDYNKDWWPQAESMVGFLNAYELSGDETYFETSYRSWKFINNFIIDKINGEWFWGVSRTGKPHEDIEKAGPWKCPYHNARACFEIIRRVDNILEKGNNNGK